jgi:hypothetical protein
MKRFALGVLVGLLLASCGFIPLWRWERQAGWQSGKNAGVIEGRFLAADALEKEFGRVDSKATCKVLFSVKTTDVVAIETNGVKTVRVIP